MGCSDCERIPDGVPRTGVLYLSPPLAHTRATVAKTLRELGVSYGEPLSGTLAVELEDTLLGRLGEELGERLSEMELRDTRALVTGTGVTPGLSELRQTRDLGTLLAAGREGWLLDLLRREKFTVHFQPIVYARCPESVFAYECLLRGIGEDGGLVSPGRLFGAARSSGVLFNLDRAARVKAIEEASRLGIERKVFINFSPNSIYDPAYCLQTTLEAVERSRFAPGDIVFEVTESEEISDQRQLLRILEYYREGGMGVALDDLGAGYGSLNLLASLRPDFVKLDMELVRDVDEDPYRAAIAAKLLELAGALGVEIIAEGVETAAQKEWLADHGADYLQGFHFARPATPPPMVNSRKEST